MNTFVLLAAVLSVCAIEVHAKPLKVYILAGQSNMEGPANISTIDYIGDDPVTAPLYKEMVGADGKPLVCDHAWISYLTGANDKNFEISGKLTAGYGTMWGQDPTKPGKCIGPEFTFGICMSKTVKEPFLIIKTAWGGKSLHTDFRSPSAGPYQFNEKLLEDMKKRGDDIEKMKAEKAKASGAFYRMMIEHVKKVLADPKRVCPEYDPKQGYEIAGFVWLQGWNDVVDGQTYPKRDEPGVYDLYSELLAQFIRDVRKDLKVPKMPFVIGVMGISGEKANQSISLFRKAMAAPAAMPEFKGNVIAVETVPFWDAKLGSIDDKRYSLRDVRHYLNEKRKDYPNADGHMTDAQKDEYMKEYEAKLISPEEKALWERGASNAGYHYLGCAKTFARMGKAFAEALYALPAAEQSSHQKPSPR